MRPKELQCQVCLHTYDAKEQKKKGVCPFCATVLAPMINRDAGYVHLNWQQVRVLCIYAKRWTDDFDTDKRGNRDAVQALMNIINHLKQYRPKGGEPIIVDPILETNPNPTMNLQPNAQGLIESPFYRKGIL